MIFTTDDLCIKYIHNFSLFDEIKEKYPDFKLIAFTISNFENKESLKDDQQFKEWYSQREEWVEIAVHSFDHMYPPDGDRDDQRMCIEKALLGLKEYLPEEYGYRSPGWQTTSKTVTYLKELGFSYIAYENKIKDLKSDTIREEKVANSHLYDEQSIRRFYEILQNTH